MNTYLKMFLHTQCHESLSIKLHEYLSHCFHLTYQYFMIKWNSILLQLHLTYPSCVQHSLKECGNFANKTVFEYNNLSLHCRQQVCSGRRQFTGWCVGCVCLFVCVCVVLTVCLVSGRSRCCLWSSHSMGPWRLDNSCTPIQNEKVKKCKGMTWFS